MRRVQVLAFLVSLSCAAGVHAQYPARPINLVVPFTAGSDADLAARNLAQHAPRHLGGIAAVRGPDETEAFVRAQFELYDGLSSRLGLGQ